MDKIHGVIINNQYIKYEDEKQKLRMSGGSWTVKLCELNSTVDEIIYKTAKGIYKISFEKALKYGFRKTFNDEEKLIIPIKHWEFTLK